MSLPGPSNTFGSFRHVTFAHWEAVSSLAILISAANHVAFKTRQEMSNSEVLKRQFTAKTKLRHHLLTLMSSQTFSFVFHIGRSQIGLEWHKGEWYFKVNSLKSLSFGHTHTKLKRTGGGQNNDDRMCVKCPWILKVICICCPNGGLYRIV